MTLRGIFYEKCLDNLDNKYIKKIPEAEDRFFCWTGNLYSLFLEFLHETCGRPYGTLSASVTQRIKMIKQPYGGYLPRKNFKIIYMNDGIVLNETENIYGGLVGIVVDYLTRFMMGTPAEEAFAISLKGAQELDTFLSADKPLSTAKRITREQKTQKGYCRKSLDWMKFQLLVLVNWLVMMFVLGQE